MNNTNHQMAHDTDLPEKLSRLLSDAQRGNRNTKQQQASGPWQSMAPELAFGRHRGPAPRNAHRAAVVITLTPKTTVVPGMGGNQFEWTIPLTVRASSLHDHGGQIALPGGRLEKDERGWDAGRREYHEELFSRTNSMAEAKLGSPTPLNTHRPAASSQDSSLEHLGELSPIYVYASNNQVEVFVAAEKETPIYVPSTEEVEQVLIVPLSFLLNEESRVIGTMGRGTTTFEAPGYRFGKHFIWGATAMILAEFVGCVRECT